MKENFKKWAVDTGVRVIKTMAETAISVIGTASAMGEVDWKLVASSVALSGVLTVLFNVKKIPTEGADV